MRYGQIRQYDVANGPGIRTTFFVTGCTHKCPECFNQEYQDFSYGDLWTDKETQKVIDYLNEDVVQGLTILGGEPFQNTKDLIDIVGKIRKNTEKSIWIYSGYTFEEILEDSSKLELLKLLRLRFKGSSNQRIIKVPESLENGSIVLWEE